MRTACVLQRQWSHLRRVCQGIGSSYAPLRNLQTPSDLWERSIPNTSSMHPCVLSALKDLARTPSAFALSCTQFRHGYWSSYRIVSQEANGKNLPAYLYRPSGIYGFWSGDADNGESHPSSTTPSSYTSKRPDDYGGDPKGVVCNEANNDGLKVLKWLTQGSSHFEPVDEGRRYSKTWDITRTGPRNTGSIHGASLASTGIAPHILRVDRVGGKATALSHCRAYSAVFSSPIVPGSGEEPRKVFDYSQRAVVTALWCNFLVFALKIGVWIMTSSHVMLAEAIHSLADLANQGLIAYGLMSSKRAPDAMHPYGYSKERFVWSLISAVGIFCLGAGATIIHGVQNLWTAQPLENAYLAALVITGSMIMEGASLLVAISCVRNGAKAEGMSVRDYLWRGHDPTSVAVMMEDGAAVTGLAIAGLALTAAHYTGNPMWDPIGSVVVGNLLGAVAIFLIQRNRQALLGRSMDEQDVARVMGLLSKDSVVDAVYDCKSEVIGPGAYRFKAEIDFNGVTIVQNYIRRAGSRNWQKEFQDAVSSSEPGHLDRVMTAYGEEVVSALGSEVDRLEREIQRVVPGIRHVDIEAHNPDGPAPGERLHLPFGP